MASTSNEGKADEKNAHYISEKVAIIERRLMAGEQRCPENIRMMQELIYNYDTNGDPTWPMRQARDIRQTSIRSLIKAYPMGTFEEIRLLVLQCWYEAWRRTDVVWGPTNTENNMVAKHVMELLKISEENEVPPCPDEGKLMEFVNEATLQQHPNLFHLAEFEALTTAPWAALELQTFVSKTSDEAVATACAAAKQNFFDEYEAMSAGWNQSWNRDADWWPTYHEKDEQSPSHKQRSSGMCCHRRR